MPSPFRLLAVALLSMGLAACSPGGGSMLSPSGPVSIDGPGGLAPVNAFRARNGLRPLSIDPRLMNAAEQHSQRMARANRMDHNLGGQLPARMRGVGYDWAATAENLGGGYPSYDAAMRGWQTSSGHRANLLRADVTQMGVAVARSPSGVPYWTQIFGRERGR